MILTNSNGMRCWVDPLRVEAVHDLPTVAGTHDETRIVYTRAGSKFYADDPFDRIVEQVEASRTAVQARGIPE